MGNKRYYWLKLKDDFFWQPKIKKLRQIAGGDTYTVIYLKLQLLSLQDDGRLIYEGIESTVAEEMALKIDEEPENVQVVLNYLKQQGLIEEADENEFSLTETQKLIGSETDKAELMRQSRARKRESMQEISNNVTQQLPPVTNCYREIEIRDRDKRKEIDKEINKESGHCPPKCPPENADICHQSVPYELVKDAYNSICKSYPKCTVLSDKRKKAIKARFREGYTLEQIKQVFAMAEESDFLKGKNDRNWSATFDWMLNSNNMAKILDGNYSRGEKNGNQSTGRDAGNTKQSCKYGITL